MKFANIYFLGSDGQIKFSDAFKLALKNISSLEAVQYSLWWHLVVTNMKSSVNLQIRMHCFIRTAQKKKKKGLPTLYSWIDSDVPNEVSDIIDHFVQTNQASTQCFWNNELIFLTLTPELQL